jgi:serine/threonine protein kinase
MLLGQNIGPFKVEREIGSGAMGTVYRATYTKGDKTRRVAIKVIAPGLGDNDRIRARFQREGDILKQLKHPNIVRLLATGKVEGRPFYAMEFIDGHALDRQLAQQNRFPWDKVVELGKQICAALQHAHDHGIIHRDLKPSNLMVDRNGTLKLTDFGIAKDSDMTGLTSANSTVGTAAYMSPEQCRGERDLTPKSDLYALGVVLYELLTGRKPFAAENAMDMFIQHVSGTFERPARIVMDIPPWLDTLVCQLMEKKPEHRPADAQTVSKALEDVQYRVETHKSLGAEVATKVARRGSGKDRDLAEEIVAGKRIKKRKERTRAERRKQLLSASGIIVLLAGLTFLLIFALQGPRPEAMLQKALKDIDRFNAALSAPTPDYYAVYQVWDQAKTELNTLVARYPESSEAATAREKLVYLDAGNYYRLGVEALDNNPEKNWKKALDRGFEKLFEINPALAKPFHDQARQTIQEFHAPELLAEGKAKANPNDEKEWDAALKALNTILQRYPDSKQVNDARDVFNRLTVQKNALEGLRKRDLLNDPEWKRLANRFEKSAVTALHLELTGNKDDAKKEWTQLAAEGDRIFEGATKYITMKDYRPWILLAQAKLEALGKSGN